jgi:hypothetical protein
MDVISFCWFSALFEVCWRSQRGIHRQNDQTMLEVVFKKNYPRKKWLYVEDEALEVV